MTRGRNNLTNEALTRAFQRLSDKRAQFLSFVQKRVESTEIAEDILQTAYLRAFEHLNQLHDKGRAEAWFYRLLRNSIIDHYRRCSASPVTSGVELDELPPEPHPPQSNPCPCAARELMHLRKDYSQALETIEMKGIPVQTFARRERITPGNASVRLHRARKALARRIQATCRACAGAGCFDCLCSSALSTLPTSAAQV